MALVAVWEMPDGSVAVTNPSARVQLTGETDAAYIARLASESERAYTLRRAQEVPAKVPGFDGVRFVILDIADLPSEPNIRRWRLKGNRVVVEKEQPPA